MGVSGAVVAVGAREVVASEPLASQWSAVVGGC
jgi:hypothetical protein